MQPIPNSPQAQWEVRQIAAELRAYTAEGITLDSMTLAVRLWQASKRTMGTLPPRPNPIEGDAN